MIKRLEDIINNTVGVVLAAMVVSFFALMWKDTHDIKDQNNALITKIEKIEQKVDATRKVTTLEIAKLKAEHKKDSEVEESLRGELEKIKQEQDNLELKIANKVDEAASTEPIEKSFIDVVKDRISKSSPIARPSQIILKDSLDDFLKEQQAIESQYEK